MKVIKREFCKYILLAISLPVIFFTLPAYAHLKWFVETRQPTYDFSGNLLVYTSVWLLVCFVAIIVGMFLDKRYSKISSAWEPKKIEPYATAIIGILIGISLLINASQEALFSANIISVGPMHLTVLLLEGFIGLSLIIGLAVRQASLLLMGLWISALYFADTIDILENMWILGAALFLFFRGRTVLRYTHEDVFFSQGDFLSQAQAINFLRLFLGANLIFLGLSEKILFPDLGLAFLQENQWNFMSSLGFSWFTNELFVFSAGAVEIILGLFLVVGWVTRLTSLVLAGFFLTPPFFMGATEMIGHIPHLTIVAAMLIFGRGALIRINIKSLSENENRSEEKSF